MTSILFQNKTLTDKPVLNIEIDIHEITDIIIVLDPKKQQRQMILATDY
jgi:hypothetical protein